MIEILMIGILQAAFQLSRTLGTRLIATNDLKGTLIMSQVIQALWLITTSMGVKAVFDMNWYAITSYMLGGLLGTFLAMVIKIKPKHKGQ